MNIVFWSIIFFFVGAFWQIIDSILGVKVFRIWYNLTHKEPLMPEIRRGFITKRGSKANAFWAFIGSLVLCLLFVFQGDAGSLTKMMLWFLGIPVIMIGFYFGGPGLKKMWKKRDIFFEKFDGLFRAIFLIKSERCIYEKEYSNHPPIGEFSERKRERHCPKKQINKG